jgi:hypothetical protein
MKVAFDGEQAVDRWIERKLSLPCERVDWAELPEIKVAYSPGVRTLAEILQFVPSSGPIPNSPGPLKSLLATSALLGAGGYGLGWLGEKILPEDWERGRLRKTLGITGAVLGAVPSTAWMMANILTGRNVLSNELLNHPPIKEAVERLREAKTAASNMSMEELRPIDVDSFNEAVWIDPRVSDRLTNLEKARALSVLNTAQLMPDPNPIPGYVTPMQLARLSWGMGRGWLSGAVVGKLLGVATGAPKSVQDTLKATGFYAGLVQSLAPAVLGTK